MSSICFTDLCNAWTPTFRYLETFTNDFYHFGIFNTCNNSPRREVLPTGKYTFHGFCIFNQVYVCCFLMSSESCQWNFLNSAYNAFHFWEAYIWVFIVERLLKFMLVNAVFDLRFQVSYTSVHSRMFCTPFAFHYSVRKY